MNEKSLSVVEWSRREGVPLRKAHRWVSQGKIPHVIGTVTRREIPSNITLKGIVNN